MRGVASCALLALASCHSPTEDAITDLRHRVSALEQAQAAGNGTASLHYQLVAPSLLSEDRYYASDAECYRAKNRLLTDAATQAATNRANNSTAQSYQGSTSFWQRLTFYRGSGSTSGARISSQPVRPVYSNEWSPSAPFVSCIPVH